MEEYKMIFQVIAFIFILVLVYYVYRFIIYSYRNNRLSSYTIKNKAKDKPENKKLILVTFFVFHFEISGKLVNDEHPKNNPFILIKLHVFHFEISGKDDKE